MAKYNETVKSIVRAIIAHNGESDKYSIHELLENVNFAICNDFNVEYLGREYRIIENSDIKEIMKDELSSDEYMLGCFNSWFLADIMNIPYDAIEKIQKADCYDGSENDCGGYTVFCVN